MGGKNSGRYKRYNIPRLGQIKLKTLAKLIDKGWVTVKCNIPEAKQYDAIIIDDKNGIILKGIKKIAELE